MDEEIDKEELEGFSILKEGSDDIDVVEPEVEVVEEDPNTALYDNAFAKEEDGYSPETTDPDALEMSKLIFDELGYEDR